MEALLRALNLLSNLEDAGVDTGRGVFPNSAADAPVDVCDKLRRTARAVGEEWTDRLSRMSDLQISSDIAQTEKRRRVEVEGRHLARAKAKRLYAKPGEWHGKAQHRVETTGDEHVRKDAEQKERKKWAKKILRILVDAELPFGAEAFENGLGLP